MREEFEGEDQTEGARGRLWPLVVIGGVVVWLLLTGGSIPGLSILWGMVPETGGVLTVGHLVLLVLILTIANFVLRMPREGGPLIDESGSDELGSLEPESRPKPSTEESRTESEFPETGSP